MDEYLERERQLNELSNTVPIIPKHVKKSSNGARKNYNDADRTLAATKLQAMYRGYALRSQWAYEDGAIRIQAVFRGYCARVRVYKMIEQLMESGALSA